MTKQKQRVELLHKRDPDSECSIDVFVDGILVEDVTEFSVDAGAGTDWSDWVESRAEDIAGASPVVAARLWAECVNPPGGEYIDGMPESVARRERDLKAAVRAASRSARNAER